MKNDSIIILPIVNKVTTKLYPKRNSVCWIKNEVKYIEVNGHKYEDLSHSIIFLKPEMQWKIVKANARSSSGYILYLDEKILGDPILNNLHINDVRLLGSTEIPKIKLVPGIEKRTQDILEMIDELIGSNLNHKDDAILFLLNTFFIYCDGQCNITSVPTEKNAKKNLVFKFKKLLPKYVSTYHRVSDYARLLNVSDKYLNQCVKEVLGASASSFITEIRLMKSRHALKFTDKTIKEIGFELGFTSPDYFSYFLKKHTGYSPTSLRKSI